MEGVVSDKGLFSRSSQSEVKGASLKDFLESLNSALSSYGINACIDKAHFLAHVAVESDELRTTEEYRSRNGSVPQHWKSYSGGEKYHGRGLIQLTHDYNYRKYSSHVGHDYVLRPELVASELSVAVDSACWYWRKGSAWGDMSKRAKGNDFIYTTIGVNGGFMHADRRKGFLRSLAAGLCIEQCAEYGHFAFERFIFLESAVSKTKNGPRVWRQFFGGHNEV